MALRPSILAPSVSTLDPDLTFRLWRSHRETLFFLSAYDRLAVSVAKAHGYGDVFDDQEPVFVALLKGAFRRLAELRAFSANEFASIRAFRSELWTAGIPEPEEDEMQLYEGDRQTSRRLRVQAQKVTRDRAELEKLAKYGMRHRA